MNFCGREQFVDLAVSKEEDDAFQMMLNRTAKKSVNERLAAFNGKSTVIDPKIAEELLLIMNQLQIYDKIDNSYVPLSDKCASQLQKLKVFPKSTQLVTEESNHEFQGIEPEIKALQKEPSKQVQPKPVQIINKQNTVQEESSQVQTFAQQLNKTREVKELQTQEQNDGVEVEIEELSENGYIPAKNRSLKASGQKLGTSKPKTAKNEKKEEIKEEKEECLEIEDKKEDVKAQEKVSQEEQHNIQHIVIVQDISAKEVIKEPKEVIMITENAPIQRTISQNIQQIHSAEVKVLQGTDIDIEYKPQIQDNKALEKILTEALEDFKPTKLEAVKTEVQIEEPKPEIEIVAQIQEVPVLHEEPVQQPITEEIVVPLVVHQTQQEPETEVIHLSVIEKQSTQQLLELIEHQDSLHKEVEIQQIQEEIHEVEKPESVVENLIQEQIHEQEQSPIIENVEQPIQIYDAPMQPEAKNTIQEQIQEPIEDQIELNLPVKQIEQQIQVENLQLNENLDHTTELESEIPLQPPVPVEYIPLSTNSKFEFPTKSKNQFDAEPQKPFFTLQEGVLETDEELHPLQVPKTVKNMKQRKTLLKMESFKNVQLYEPDKTIINLKPFLNKKDVIGAKNNENQIHARENQIQTNKKSLPPRNYGDQIDRALRQTNLQLDVIERSQMIQMEETKKIEQTAATAALKNRLAQIEVLKTQIQKLSTAQALKTAEINLNIEPEMDSKQETQPEEHNELKLEELTIQEEKSEQIIEAKQFKVFAQKNCLKLEADGQFYFCGLIESNFEVKDGAVFMKCRQSYKEVTVKFQDPDGQKWRMIKRLL
ncbi:Hypothetical_protein [Hexamita inflata]|uniref:Hypothetical_protein n=1 Tax=Hexamita inflata TaxID=28002 RepID=A0AA86UBD2_9EUKA|nr:Hypothetical protein HINF_LOCUS32267 [Hexamita inflata]